MENSWKLRGSGRRLISHQQLTYLLTYLLTYFLPPLLSTEHKALSHADADWDHSVYCTRGIVPPEPDPPPLAVGRPRWIVTMTIRIRASNGFRQVCLYTLPLPAADDPVTNAVSSGECAAVSS